MSSSGRGMASALSMVAVLWAAAASAEGDWPQFLGARRDGVAAEARDLARSWPPGGPKLLWRVPLGAGFAGAAIQGDSVLLLDREGDARDVLRRLRLADGQEVWRFAYDAPGKLDHNGSRTTPASDGALVFVIGPFGHFHAVRFSDGSLVWKAHLLDDWEGERPRWGVGQSPLLAGEAVVVAPWGKKAAVVAYQKADGKVLWQTPNARGMSMDYSSPMPMTLDGQPTIVSSGRHGPMIGVDARTGKELWFYGSFHCRNHVPSPAPMPDGRVLLTGGYGAGGVMVKIERAGEEFTTRELWKSRVMSSKLGQPLLYKGYVYANSSDNLGGLTCITLDGQLKWQTRSQPGFEMGNLLIADGLIFIVGGSDGQLVMAEASPDGYKELGRASFLKGPEAWAPLAYSQGKLVLRDQTTMVCVDLAAK